MQFNNTTSGLGLIQQCEDDTNLGDTGISGNTALLKRFTRSINKWYHIVETWIIKAQDNWDFDDSNKSDLPILTTNLVASQQDYTLPAATLKVKRVKIAYDGTNWYWAKPTDIDSATGGTTATTVDGDEASRESKPKYDIVGNSLFLHPVPTTNRTSCLKIWVSREPTEFTTASTTTEPGFDEAFHYLLGKGASYDYAVSKTLPNKNDLWSEILLGRQDLKDYYQNKSKDVVSRMIPLKEDNK